ncbi:GPI-anchored cell wall organization protein Ecm33 [Delitschia confertaspora ATCC 74209]|uniref:GPI-anchored cell wall organization protein Ecm33 n=1 Tax=Delitschia confertaspora ATCC 74209 TaxID=1513339 RepID=A0A9P4JM13_9PLEO|nr:GPI-anchored cell wall organization protein Ecm33 [Delitschia confertaspora ATCC 74209]
MSLSKFILPALAAASTAYAASCSVSATSTIQNSGDATQLASCTTFSGSIAIATQAAGDINISGLRKIDGDLIMKNNTAVNSLSADSLEVITGQFALDGVQGLTRLSFPKLSTVDSVVWNAFGPNLNALEFNHAITKAKRIDIQNTQLGSLNGINVETLETLYIANNRYIGNISMQLGNVTNGIILEANNPEVEVTFPNLIWAMNMTFRNCSSIQVPSLESLNGSLGLYGNVIDSFIAPNLTKIGGALALVSNTELTNISFPELTEVNADLQVANNTLLKKIDAFPKLKTIGGAFDFNGNFSDVQTPALNDVKGAFNLQSTGDVQKQCDEFYKPLKNKGKIQGYYECKGEVVKPGGQGTTPTVSGSGPKKTGAASALNVQSNAAAMGLMGLAAAFFL